MVLACAGCALSTKRGASTARLGINNRAMVLSVRDDPRFDERRYALITVKLEVETALFRNRLATPAKGLTAGSAIQSSTRRSSTVSGIEPAPDDEVVEAP